MKRSIIYLTVQKCEIVLLNILLILTLLNINLYISLTNRTSFYAMIKGMLIECNEINGQQADRFIIILHL